MDSEGALALYGDNFAEVMRISPGQMSGDAYAIGSADELAVPLGAGAYDPENARKFSIWMEDAQAKICESSRVEAGFVTIDGNREFWVLGRYGDIDEMRSNADCPILLAHVFEDEAGIALETFDMDGGVEALYGVELASGGYIIDPRD